ncbi:DUF4232 domain-containing protein [Streptomyces mexicanus]|uniref:DUF4232 domain-containing protein n=1 Tax=Streptomyces mexicanus TaxID=178566 RepID=UPI00365E3209
MRVQKLGLAALALAAGLSLTACQGSGNSAGKSDDSAASSSASSGGGSSSTGASSSSAGASGGSTVSGKNATSGGGGSAAAKSAQGSGGGQISTGLCRTANLGFGTAHGMGEGELIVSLKNNGGDTCSLKGFPGVDLMSQDASEPLSARRSDLAAPAVTLQPGEETRFTLHYPPNHTGGTGVYVSAIVVTPPDETHSKALSVSIDIPVTATAADDVRVDPVGTGKQ